MTQNRLTLNEKEYTEIGRMLMTNVPYSEIMKKYKMTNDTLNNLIFRLRKKGLPIPYKNKIIGKVATILKKEFSETKL